MEESGIIVYVDEPFQGRSPDGLVGRDSVIEIKCPYNARNYMINPETVPFFCSGVIVARLA